MTSSLTRAPIEPIRRKLLAHGALRGLGLPVIHTREGHRPDLSDLPANKRWRSRQIGARHPAMRVPTPGEFLVRGEAGWDIITELAPIEQAKSMHR